MTGVNTLDDSGSGTVGVSGTPRLNAQQTNLVRSVIDAAHQLDGAPFRDPKTGRRAVSPLTPREFVAFRAAWEKTPVLCIRSMNLAISQMADPRRVSRYLEAAVDLEILMDRDGEPPGPSGSQRELRGIPSYLVDGYTDLGIQVSVDALRPREKIFVDKEKMRTDLVRSKRHAILEVPRRESEAQGLEAALLAIGRALRESLGYDESAFRGRRDDGTMMLSESVAERSVNCRHLAILYQLRLQEAGISSRLAKGVLRLFGLKLRHAWNLVQEGSLVALVDVAFGESNLPLVLVGASFEDVYERARKLHRIYCPTPESFHRYQVRSACESHGH